MKLVVFTPLPPAATGVADYASVLLAALSARAPRWRIETVSSESEADAFRPPDEPHALLYQVGNSSHHDFLYPALFRHPGVLVLHDLVLHHARLLSHLRSDEVRAYQEDLASVEKRDRGSG